MNEPTVREPKTPWNPSRKAVKRVRSPLPAPTACPNCGAAVELVGNEKVYGRPYGEWPWTFRCVNDACDSYVGLHPFTGIPLGTLANAEMRDARKRAKAVFNPLWEEGDMSRSEAYAWLAGELGIANVEECHIGWFGVERCEAVRVVCGRRLHADEPPIHWASHMSPFSIKAYLLAGFRLIGVPA